MSDDARRDGIRAKAELEQTAAAFGAVREAMIDKLLSSAITESDEREKLYLAVQVLDAVRVRMTQVASSADIEAYAEEIRARGLAA